MNQSVYISNLFTTTSNTNSELRCTSGVASLNMQDKILLNSKLWTYDEKEMSNLIPDPALTLETGNSLVL